MKISLLSFISLLRVGNCLSNRRPELHQFEKGISRCPDLIPAPSLDKARGLSYTMRALVDRGCPDLITGTCVKKGKHKQRPIYITPSSKQDFLIPPPPALAPHAHCCRRRGGFATNRPVRNIRLDLSAGHRCK